MNFKYVGLDAATYHVVLGTYGEFKFYQTCFAIDGVHYLRLVDITIRLVKQSKRKSVKHSRLTRTVLTNDQCVRESIKWNFGKVIAGGKKILPPYSMKNNHSAASASV